MTEPRRPDSPPLSRRRLLGLAGAAGATVSLGGLGPLRPLTALAQSNSAEGVGCVLTPTATEGPYYLDDGLVRGDIREGRGGEVLRLVLTVVDVAGCAPIEGATVEIWHADRQGNYSGFGNTTANDTFLRGGQISGVAGKVRFTTTYPGWYPGRCAHIHVKVHVGGDEVHTGQIYFPQAANNEVYAQTRYQHAGNRVTNRQDGIYNGSGGAQTKVALTRPGGGGYKGTLTMGVQT